MTQVKVHEIVDIQVRELNEYRVLVVGQLVARQHAQVEVHGERQVLALEQPLSEKMSQIEAYVLHGEKGVQRGGMHALVRLFLTATLSGYNQNVTFTVILRRCS